MAEVLERQFTSITANIGGPDSPIRRDRFDGKEYIVAPMASLAEGVIDGSGGAFFYSNEHIGRNPASWNHKPMVVGHPMVNGKYVQACDPATLERQGVGLIFNSMFDGKLRHEAWIDPIKAMAIEPRILEALDKGEKMEISTGLFTSNIMTPGKFNDKDYIGVATNFQPDHVAILPDTIGAYSIEDGGGLLQVNESTRLERVEFIHNRKWSQAERDALSKSDFGDPEKRLFPIVNQEDVNSAKHLIGKAGNPDAVKKRIIAIAKRKGLSIPAEWHGHGMTLTNEMSTIGDGTPSSTGTDTTASPKHSGTVAKMSHSNLRRALGDKLRSSKGSDASKSGTASISSDLYQGYSYVEDVYDDSFIYSDENGKLFKQGYTTDGSEVTFKGGATPAKRVTEYRDAVSDAYIGNSYTQISQRELELMTVKNDAGNTVVAPAPATTPAAGTTPIANSSGGTPTEPTATAPIVNKDTADNTGQEFTDGKGSPATILKPAGAPSTATATRETMANELISGGGWNNTDKGWLVGLDDARFNNIYQKYTSVVAATAGGSAGNKTGGDFVTDGPGTGSNSGPATNEKNKGDTTLTTANNGGAPILNPSTPVPQQPVGVMLTKEEREFLANGLAKMKEQREFLITNIAKHPKNRFNEAYLRNPARELDELVGLAGMLDLPTSPEQMLANSSGAYAGLGLGSFTLGGALQANQAQIDDMLNPKEAPLGVPIVANESPDARKARMVRVASGKPLLERRDEK